MREDGYDDEILTRHDWNGDGQFLIDQAAYDAVTEVIARFIGSKSSGELMARAISERILMAPVSGIDEVFANPHFRARGLFEPLVDESRGLNLELPSRWANLSGTPLHPPRVAPACDPANSGQMS